jgi:hypothetical protein
MPQLEQRERSDRSSIGPRQWYMEALSAIAYGALALCLGKTVSRALGPLPGLLFLLVLAGLSWYHGKAAWHGLIAARDRAAG